MFFRKEFFSVKFCRKKIFLGFLFRTFYFHEKNMFLEVFDFELFYFKRNNFSEFKFFSKKMLGANVMRFRRKRLEKQTRIDNFSLKKKIQNEFIWLLCTF